jgi:hypothetical protein
MLGDFGNFVMGIVLKRNTYVKYQSPNTYHSKDTAKESFQ